MSFHYLQNANVSRTKISGKPFFRRDEAAVGRRISLEQRVVIFMLIDLAILGFFGLMAGAALEFFEAVPMQPRAGIVIFAMALFVIVSRNVAAYQTSTILDRAISPRQLAVALALTFVILIIIGAATKTSQLYSRQWFFTWAVLTCIMAPLMRLAAIAFTRRQFERGHFVHRALAASIFCDTLRAEDLARQRGGQVKIVESLRLDRLEQIEDFSDLIARDEIDQIYLVAPWGDVPLILQKLQHLRHFATEIFVLPDDDHVHALQLGVEAIGPHMAVKAVDRPINGWNLWLKRIVDILFSAGALVLLAPVMAIVALAIKLESPGPAMFRQKRVGFNGRIFELWKFRSMRVESADADATRQTSRDDPRVTRVGRFIRRTSLDELPQFFNVLQGGMSVVGPRPHALKTRTLGRELADVADQYAARHRMKPGLTGLAQVSGFRGELDTIEKVQKRVAFDIDYIRNWSLWLDIKIMARTALLIVHDPGAY